MTTKNKIYEQKRCVKQIRQRQKEEEKKRLLYFFFGIQLFSDAKKACSKIYVLMRYIIK